MNYTIVDITENDTGDALISEVLSIPLLVRGEPSIPLVTAPARTKLATGTLSEWLGLPTLVKSDKGRAGLIQGTILGRFLPELIK